MSTLLRYKGSDYPVADLNSLTPGEADKIERVVGMTFGKIRRTADRCVCEHPSAAHAHEADETDETDQSCTQCGDCAEFEADMPTIVSTALMWLAVRRRDPAITFKAVSDTSFEEIDYIEVDDEADPTEPPPAAA